MKITKIEAMEVLDSRGNPTVKAYVYSGGHVGTAIVPCGASTGTYEAIELRDGDTKRYLGKGVLKAVKNVNTSIAKELEGFEATEQKKIDDALIALDGTENKSKLGANAILSVSMAASRLAAGTENLELYQYIAKTYGYKVQGLPTPMMNVINGGAHADWVTDIQEYMLVPHARKFSDKLRIGSEIYHTLKPILKKQKLAVGVGDEGGFAPKLDGNGKAFEILTKAIIQAGYKPGKDVSLAFDAAASEFYEKGIYNLRADTKKLSSKALLSLYSSWQKKYKLLSMEDAFHEDDFEAWSEITKKLGSKIMVVGDDLFVTNIKRLHMGIAAGWANSILVKLNQIGTVNETIETIKMAQKAKYKIIISHRSGETEDTFIADLAVATNAEYIKTGSLARSERIAKYNRLLEIERGLI